MGRWLDWLMHAMSGGNGAAGAGTHGLDDVETIVLPPVPALPPPEDTGLVAALYERRSQRDYSPRVLPPDVLGQLLWAACGINRRGTDGRTAPSPLGVNEIDVYAAFAHGVYRYVPHAHVLRLHRPIDLRGLAGLRDTPSPAPLDLIYVADLSRMKPVPPRRRETFAAVTTGAIAQNVYLCCASMRLATTLHGWLNQDELSGAMLLDAHELPVLAQTVGYPSDPGTGAPDAPGAGRWT
jgi:Nitroreductase family